MASATSARDLPVLRVDDVQQARPVDLVALAPEEPFGGGSVGPDPGVVPHDEDDVGRVLDQRSEARLVRAGRALGGEPRPRTHGDDMPRQDRRGERHPHEDQHAEVQAEPVGDGLGEDDEADRGGCGRDERGGPRCRLGGRGFLACPPLAPGGPRRTSCQ